MMSRYGNSCSGKIIDNATNEYLTDKEVYHLLNDYENRVLELEKENEELYSKIDGLDVDMKILLEFRRNMFKMIKEKISECEQKEDELISKEELNMYQFLKHSMETLQKDLYMIDYYP